MQKFYPELDGWRGYAIASVLVAHFSTVDSLRWMGLFGVAMFFALSGRLITGQLFDPQVSLRKFLIRRFSRVYPLFFIYIIIVYLFYLTYYHSEIDYNFDPIELFSFLTFSRSYFPSDPNIWEIPLPLGHLCKSEGQMSSGTVPRV